jgi:hypothetical protein
VSLIVARLRAAGIEKAEHKDPEIRQNNPNALPYREL